jgi:hypothetical protein
LISQSGGRETKKFVSASIVVKGKAAVTRKAPNDAQQPRHAAAANLAKYVIDDDSEEDKEHIGTNC